MCKAVVAMCLWLVILAAHGLEPETIFERVSPSIWVVQVFDSEGVKKGIGSAVVVNQEELITNCHVLMKAKSLSIKRENTAHSASLVHADVERDLCIIRAKGMTAPAVQTALLHSVKVGQRVYTIGAPLGYELTLADGLVSSLKKDNDGRIRSIQISVPISPGSSGGGLFDQEGRLIGITTGTRPDGQNLNFAIPAEWIADVPERSAIALAEYRKPLIKNYQPSSQPATQNANERQLQGDELRAHFASLSKVPAKLMQRDVVMDRSWGARISFLDRQSGMSVSGKYQFDDDKNQVCFNLFVYGGVNPLRPVNDCFDVFEVGPRAFMLRARDGTTVSYALN